jgi:hypothetical protein
LNLVEKYTLQSVSFKPLLNTPCKVKDCSKEISCKGFCKKHYNDFFKNRRDFEGNCINGYTPKIKNAKCRFPNCNTVGNKKNCLRKGLCNKHRKWAEKKIIDFKTCEILDPSRIPKEKEWFHCKIPKCLGKHKALGFCSNHYRSYKYHKTIDKDGRKIGFKLTYDKNSKCKVINCSNKGRFVRGFCRLHYRQFTDKIIDQDGLKLNGLKRIYKYPKNALCKGEGCKNKPSQNWFCNSCSSKIKFGSLTSEGKKTEKHIFKNVGKKCLEKKCNNLARTKGFCMKHYNIRRYPKQYPLYKNVGQKCTITGCKEKAYCRAMCGKHYRKKIREEKGLNTKTYLNKDSVCRVDSCSNKAYSKMLCLSHYSFFTRNSNKEYVSNIDLKLPNFIKNNIIVNKKLCQSIGCKRDANISGLCTDHFLYFKSNKPNDLDILKSKILVKND